MRLSSLTAAADRIRSWSRDSASLTDEGLAVPSREAIARASGIIDEMKNLVGAHLDFKGVSLGSGGEISIELGSGSFAVTYRVEPDGAVTELFFHNNRLLRASRV